uniref:RRM domain-containing protein n=1 Tax=Aplanochytrium stocchinoi TaxID=215587 RepID=A0A7S3LJQ7_9STRA|mmetsp:Transcript_14796/g.18293  ORF Transcript_14796/g.18293 Transcript_14796/m.18293 type:complete len:416 (+) Transcript_14796:18-1265(+)|eukprot:CAMPEP_0204834788 /NCGR_PEP_ID=MMETSP1346-20131115/20737_1 /ASSEMBLY_ACC=CAM_ASM_000771 /TAXON_ID=215587 /ORGANISM="Aplanochytrium stocchinoi, Strain GSBS06" /LENGTH=415 /DNA_ID=CAMNT_0051968295 /DNA_START=158 /DNA_END=1405 /DNA_ORIENTATION=-
MSAFPRGQIGTANPVMSLKEATQLGRGAARKGLPPGMRLGEDFPMVCEKCLGDNPFLRMIKLPNDAACKITNKPFNVFRWRPGKGRPYKKTIVCYEIAAEKNICQSCLVDMEYGLPVALRDAFLAAQKSKTMDGVAEVPISEVNQAYYFQQKLANRDESGASSNQAASERLLRVAAEFTESNEKDRIFVENEIDPKTGKLKKKKRSLKPPEDKSITTLFLSGLPEEIDEEETKALLQPYGEIVRVYMLREKCSAFLEFSTRKEAERAIFNAKGKVMCQGKRVRVGWAEKRVDEHGAPIEPSKDQLLALREEEEEEPEPKRQKKEENVNITHKKAIEDAANRTIALDNDAANKTTFDMQKLKKDFPPPPTNLKKYAQAMLPPPGLVRFRNMPTIRYSYPSMTKSALEGIDLVVRDT